MSNHFRVLCAIALTQSLAIPSLVVAAPATPQGDIKAAKFGRGELVKSLGLTPAQKAKIMPIMDASKAARKLVSDNDSLTPDVQKAKKKAIRDTEEQKIAAVLTPAQRAKYKAGLAKIKSAKAAKDKSDHG